MNEQGRFDIGEWIPKRAIGYLALLAVLAVFGIMGWHARAFVRKVVHFGEIREKTARAMKAADLMQYELAARLATEVLEFHPGSDARILRAFAWTWCGHHDLAEKDLDTIMKERTSLRRFSGYYVRAARRAGDFRYADYEKSLLKVPLNLLARSAARSALKYYEEAIAIRSQYKTGMDPIELRHLMDRTRELREFLGK